MAGAALDETPERGAPGGPARDTAWTRALDRLPGFGPQPEPPTGAAGPLEAWSQARRGLSLHTLFVLRWIAIGGQAITVAWVRAGLGLRFPALWCLAVVAVAAVANLASIRSRTATRLAGKREALFQLGFDLVQLSLLLGMTGGVANPFCVLLIAPVAVGAATLPSRHAVLLGGFALLCLAVLSHWSLPLPAGACGAASPALYAQARVAALAVGIVFTGTYAWQASAESQRMELALAATQAVLAREQRLSALGGLAAAAAHELGTPLATIQVVTKEMARELAPGTSLREDVDLLMQQAERCRAILKTLSARPDTGDLHHARMSLSQLLDEVSEPYRDEAVLINTEVSCPPHTTILEVRRAPEVLHGLSAFIENAADYAKSAVEVTAHYDERRLTIEVRDDGPGFPPDVIAKLGQPYVTTRSHGEGSRTGHHGMGLGFFIAKTLLERTGAEVEFRNARRGGAVIAVRWPRARMEATAAEA